MIRRGGVLGKMDASKQADHRLRVEPRRRRVRLRSRDDAEQKRDLTRQRRRRRRNRRAIPLVRRSGNPVPLWMRQRRWWMMKMMMGLMLVTLLLVHPSTGGPLEGGCSSRQFAWPIGLVIRLIRGMASFGGPGPFYGGPWRRMCGRSQPRTDLHRSSLRRRRDDGSKGERVEAVGGEATGEVSELGVIREQRRHALLELHDLGSLAVLRLPLVKERVDRLSLRKRLRLLTEPIDGHLEDRSSVYVMVSDHAGGR